MNWAELFRYRDLFGYLVLRDISVLYRQTVLGLAWALITPLSSMIVFSLVFGKMLNVPSDGVPYPAFCLAGLVAWNYFSGALNASTGSLVASTALYTKVYFPRLFVPLVPIASKLVDLAISGVLLFGVLIVFRVPLSWNLVMLPVPVLLMVVAVAGWGIGLSALAVRFRDVRHAMGFATTLLQYAAPVVWPLSKVPEEYRLIYAIYPMVGVIEGFRASVLGGAQMPWALIGMGGLSSAVSLVAGLAYFRRTERGFADVA